jgi:TPR repeat protein
MRRIAWVALALVFFTLAAAPTAQAEKRIALLIGNLGYAPEVGRLKNPHNDIELVAASLKQVGFEVMPLVKEARRAVILGSVRALVARLNTAGPGAIGFLYYSGHGAAEVDTNTNYLIPIDASEPSAATFWDESLKLDDILRLLSLAREAAKFVVFDACRNELLVPAKSTSKGLVPVAEQAGMFIAYASAPGRTASDKGDKSGPYANALAMELVKPGVAHLDLFQNVKEKVLATTGGAQQPWNNDGLSRRIYIAGTAPQQTAADMPLSPTINYDKEMEITFWRSILSTRNPSELKAYIERYPNGVYVALARERIALLEKALRSGSGPQGATFLRLLPEAIVPERNSQALATDMPPEPDDCDWLTASPFDRERLAPGVTLTEMSTALKRQSEGPDKALGCRAALLRQGRSPRLQYQSARALMVQSAGAASSARSVWPWEGAPSSEVMTLLREAAEGGSSAAMIELGRMVFQGVGSEKNQIHALDWFQRAAARGDGLAMALIGVIYAGGHGMPQDQALALSWARHALDHRVAGQLVWLDPLRDFLRSGDKPFRKIGARWAELLSEHMISRFGSDKGAPELILGLAYPLLVADDALAGYWVRRSATAGNSAAVLHIAIKAIKNPDRSELLALLQAAVDAGEPASKGLLGVAAAQGDGMPRNEQRARELIQGFLASGFVSEALKLVVDVIGADMRHAGFSQPEVETHRKVLMSAVDGFGTQSGDADLIVTLLAQQGPFSLLIKDRDRVATMASAGNTNAMLAVAFSYLDDRNSPAALPAEKRRDEWQERRRAIETSSAPLPADIQAQFTSEEKREYEQLARNDHRSSKTAQRPEAQERLGQLSRLALERITKSISDDIDKERAKNRQINRQQAAEWISKAAERGSRLALAIDALFHARGLAGPTKRDIAEARARQLVATGLLDFTASLLEYAASRIPILLGPGEDEVELTRAERSAARGVARHLFDGIRERNDVVRPLLALSVFALSDSGDRHPAQVEAEALDWLRSMARRDNNAFSNVLLAAHQLMTSNDTAKLSESALKSINYLRLAAEQGEPLAQLALGIMYARGDGVARDDVFARRWVEMALGAAKLGEDVVKLAPIVRKLMDKASDNERVLGRVSDTLAADKGQAEAVIAFALLFPEPDDDAKDWLKRAADAGNSPAKALLADTELAAALTRPAKGAAPAR